MDQHHDNRRIWSSIGRPKPFKSQCCDFCFFYRGGNGTPYTFSVLSNQHQSIHNQCINNCSSFFSGGHCQRCCFRSSTFSFWNNLCCFWKRGSIFGIHCWNVIKKLLKHPLEKTVITVVIFIYYQYFLLSCLQVSLAEKLGESDKDAGLDYPAILI